MFQLPPKSIPLSHWYSYKVVLLHCFGLLPNGFLTIAELTIDLNVLYKILLHYALKNLRHYECGLPFTQ